MAKTYIVKNIILEKKKDIILYNPGDAVSQDIATKYPDNVKLVETKFPHPSGHSFDHDKSDIESREKSLDKIYNRKGGKKDESSKDKISS